jgi:hypothetical protein
MIIKNIKLTNGNLEEAFIKGKENGIIPPSGTISDLNKKFFFNKIASGWQLDSFYLDEEFDAEW